VHIGYGLSDNYVNWFRSYFTDWYSSVGILRDFSSPSAVSSGVPQGLLLGHLFNIASVT
jgi:hypothetical protein